MRLSDIPSKLAKAWAAGAGASTIHAIPVASQIPVTDGAASLTDGFPPLNAIPKSMGGIPPDIKDMNGILQMLSAWTVWYQSGGAIRYDAAYVAQNGGYPLGATLASSVTIGLQFVSTADNNTTDPDSGTSANWLVIGVHSATEDEVNAGTGGGFVTPTLLHGTTRSLVDNGYCVRADGLIEQWGVATTGNGYGPNPFYARIAFNIPFPNAVLTNQATSGVANFSASDGNTISIRPFDNASFDLACDDVARLCRWYALGF